jgi:hypothetical protein
MLFKVSVGLVYKIGAHAQQNIPGDSQNFVSSAGLEICRFQKFQVCLHGIGELLAEPGSKGCFRVQGFSDSLRLKLVYFLAMLTKSAVPSSKFLLPLTDPLTDERQNVTVRRRS